MSAVSFWAALDCTGRLRNHDQGTASRLRLSFHRRVPCAAGGDRVVFRPEFSPGLSGGVHRLPRDPRGCPGIGGEVSGRAGLQDRWLSLGLALQLRRRSQDLSGTRSRPGAGQPDHGNAGAFVALVLPLVPAAAEGGVSRRYHPFWPVRRLRTSVDGGSRAARSEEHTSELQSLTNLVCRLLL